jgi:hypothetical protein
MNDKQFLRAVQKDIRKKVATSLKKYIKSKADKNGIIDLGPQDGENNVNYTSNMITIHLSDSELKVMIAALDARDRYLAGIADRQLNYRPTETRNKKLEAIEAEILIVKRVKFRALGELHLSGRNRSIDEPAAAPAQTNTEK